MDNGSSPQGKGPPPQATYSYIFSPAPQQQQQLLARRDDTTGDLTCLCCKASFASARDMLVHQRRYTGERPFPCSKCFESFATASALLLHRGTVHDRRSPFRCIFCGRAFRDGESYASHLARHKRRDRNTSMAQYLCSCTRVFRSELELKKHLDMHDSGTGIRCPYCRKVYETKLSLASHVSRHESRKKQRERGGEERK